MVSGWIKLSDYLYNSFLFTGVKKMMVIIVKLGL